jgi:hypothetical protein
MFMAFTTTPAGQTTCQPAVCPTCGGLQCFERPRYFCGQLLTDKDLDAAQRYVIEKNRLHNRYLVGAGVVCGLAVRCHPCDDTSVVVEPGYAIDCCGNDIVLCDPEPFDVIEYLERCRREEEPDCYSKRPRKPSRCDGLSKEYCLILSYKEQHARPITALMRDKGCAVDRCEPSRTQEIFRLDLVEKAAYEKQKPSTPDFWTKLVACAKEVWPALAKYIQRISDAAASLGNSSNSADLQTFHTTTLRILCDMKDYVLSLYKKGPHVRCNLVEELCDIEDSFPLSPSENQYQTKVYGALFRMLARVFQYLIDCLCDALLVPCIECDTSEGVLLACLTVRENKVEDICNIVRQQVISGPALRYWLNPLYSGVNTLLEQLCCEIDFGELLDGIFKPRQLGFGGIRTTINRGATAFKISRDFSRSAWESLKGTDVLQFTAAEATLTAVDVYDRPLIDARSLLREKNIAVARVERHDDPAEAYALRNLATMAWVVPSGSSVALITDANDRVTCIRVIDQAHDGGRQ